MRQVDVIAAPVGTVERVLVPERSVWEYDDRGVDLGTGWRETSPSSDWARGEGPLGYGERYVVTAVSYGSDPADKHPTTYFRQAFESVDPSTIEALYLRSMFDDGFVFHLNGHEGGRALLPFDRAVSYDTLASSFEAHDTYVNYDVSAQIPNLVEGTNTLAIEVHQASRSSEDLVMDFSLVAFVRQPPPDRDAGTQEPPPDQDGGMPPPPIAGGGIPEGATWRYSDRVGDLGTAWRQPGYDDSTWALGAAPLGFGEPIIATTTSRDPLTTYYRHVFTSDGHATDVTLRANYDDGFVAYLNGTEVLRAGMPGGTFDGQTLAFDSHEAEGFETFVLPDAASLIVDGDNLLAVEVHQAELDSPDSVWDASLVLDGMSGGGGAASAVSLAAVGDFGGTDERAGTVMSDFMARGVAAFFLLGDISYGELTPEQAWCDWVHAYVGDSFPVELVAGNHEDDQQAGGFLPDFAACMPDRLESDLGPGGYGVNYASDLGPITVVATAANLQIGGVSYDYDPGSPEQTWLIDTIQSAKEEGDWVVVATHEDCITIGVKQCEIGQRFAQLLVDQGVDLVLQAHDHTYQRTHALASVIEGSVGSIADSGADGVYARGAGTVFVIAGIGGESIYPCSHSDSELGNFAVHWCAEEGSDTGGYLLLHADERSLSGELVSTVGAPFSDRFAIE